MPQITMFNVGDKQHFLYDNQDGSAIIDLGGSVINKLSPQSTYYNADALVISHYHKDHYDELINYALRKTNPQPLQRISKLYLPIIVSNEPFVHSLFVKLIAQQIILQYHKRPIVLKNIPIDTYIMLLVGGLTQEQTLTIRALSQGQTFTMAQQSYDVLWPSKDVIQTYKTQIEDTLYDFDAVYAEDETMRIAISIIEQHCRLLWTEGVCRIEIDRQAIQTTLANCREASVEQLTRTVNQTFTTKQSIINKKMGQIANHLCLAFRNEDWLFFGDLEKKDINEVMNLLLCKNGWCKYKLIVAAHHGTHSDDEQSRLQTDYCIASQGLKLHGTGTEIIARDRYSKISNSYQTTYCVKTDIIQTI